METILIYDTETTGLPLFDKPSEHPDQPHVIQLAAELCEEESGHVLASINFLIKPDGWTISEEITKLAGITQERAEKFGIPMSFVLPFFMNMWKKCTKRVAHNESFDMRMMRIELMRDKGFQESTADAWKAAPAFCTCTASKDICKLPPTERMVASGRTGFKQPNLKEAYKHFTGQELENAHNAATDIMGCKAVYYGIKKLQAQ